MKWFVFGFIFLLLTTTTHAHDDPLEDCYELDILQPYCAQVTNAINTSQITEEEGKQLLLNYMAPKNYLPQFEFTQTWNTLITPDRTPPYNLSSESKTCDIDSGVNCIDYAWLAIFGVYNAFIENNTLYTEDNGYIHTAFYYEFNKPNDPTPP